MKLFLLKAIYTQYQKGFSNPKSLIVRSFDDNSARRFVYNQMRNIVYVSNASIWLSNSVTVEELGLSLNHTDEEILMMETD